MALFDLSVQKFHLEGIRALSRSAIAQQLALPGCSMSVARYQGDVVSAHIQFSHEDKVYAHLAAKKPIAYEVGADYALYYAEIEHFRGISGWTDWGGGPGLASGATSLDRFKRGWSTGIRPAYFGGWVLDRQRYDELVRRKGSITTNYFPAYRSGEFF